MKRQFTIPFIFSFTLFILALLGFILAYNRSPIFAAPTAVTLYVNAATGDDNNDCLSAALPCLTVGEAISKAVDGDSIQVAAGVYDEFLDVSKPLTITGAGPALTFLDGGDSHRVMQNAGSEWLNLVDLSVSNGRVTGENGAGILNFGYLSLQNVEVFSNTTDGGGGGIYNNGHILLQNSRIMSNSVEGAGGGIYLWYNSWVTATNSLFTGNSASVGGGFFNLGMLLIEDSSLENNSGSTHGGAVATAGTASFDGSTELNRVTIVGNQSDGVGAGIHNSHMPLTLTNVTISDNEAPTQTGLVNLGELSQVTIVNSTIAYNHVSGTGTRHGGIANVSNGNLTIKNSIVAENEGRNCLVSGNWTSEGYNLSSDGYCDFTATGDMLNTDPLLYPLADYGGATWTHALLSDSPAVDAADNGSCPATDQRGVARPFDGDNDNTAVCDIGAYEVRNQITIADVEILEGDAGATNAVFTVTLAPTSTQLVTVDYATMDDTAVAGSDYLADSDFITFSPGESTKFVTISVIGDMDDEPNEAFFLNLSNTNGADVVDGVGVGTIIDDDGLPSLTIADVVVNEGDTGTAVAEFTVSLSPASADTVQVAYATANDTAVAGEDYVAAADTLTFDPGETSQTIQVTVNGDPVDEGTSEMFNVNLSSPLNANLVDDTAVGTITDDDTARVSMGFSQSAVEGNIGQTDLVFSVTLNIPTAFPVTVDYSSGSGIGGTFATPGVDYVEVSGTLQFDPGETLKTFTVSIIGDIEAEEDEHFSVNLSNADPVSVYITSAIGNILDDDGNPVYLPMIVKP